MFTARQPAVSSMPEMIPEELSNIRLDPITGHDYSIAGKDDR